MGRSSLGCLGCLGLFTKMRRDFVAGWIVLLALERVCEVCGTLSCQRWVSRDPDQLDAFQFKAGRHCGLTGDLINFALFCQHVQRTWLQIGRVERC